MIQHEDWKIIFGSYMVNKQVPAGPRGHVVDWMALSNGKQKLNEKRKAKYRNYFMKDEFRKMVEGN